MIYLVRHGQTDWNLQGINQGRKDIELNKTGIEQAETLANKLKNVKFDAVLSSPLKRTIKTAQIICQDNIIIDDRLIERSNGELEGRKNTKDIIDFTDPKDVRYGIEPLPEFRKRIKDFWDEVLKKYVNKNVLIVTHAGVTMYSQAYLKGEFGYADYTSYKLENGEVLEIPN